MNGGRDGDLSGFGGTAAATAGAVPTGGATGVSAGASSPLSPQGGVPNGRSPRVRLRVTGHSMGGAMAMLASLELASRYRRRVAFQLGTYTFAAPRVGNGAFARLFELAFPEAADHWALQEKGDAIPHLPFARWGFRHPQGTLVFEEAFEEETPPKKGEKQKDGKGGGDEHGGGGGKKNADKGGKGSKGGGSSGGSSSRSSRRGSLRRSGDRGDSLSAWVHAPHRLSNWATCHNLETYVEQLQSLVRVHSASGDSASSGADSRSGSHDTSSREEISSSSSSRGGSLDSAAVSDLSSGEASPQLAPRNIVC